ncbi:MAG TPA: FtsX-like permease family protein [Allosphingosinicella sp.]
MSRGIGRARALRHHFVAYVRSLQATKLLSAIAVFGLAIGLAGAILMGLVARTALGFNGFVPDHERIHLGLSVLSGPGMPPNVAEITNLRAADMIEANVADVEAAVRLVEAPVELRRGKRAITVPIYWTDPDAFDLLQLPVLSGDLRTALSRPEGLLMTESAAMRFFGSTALGQRIAVAGQPMELRAVIRDLPAGRTDLASGVFASGLAAGSPLAGTATESPDGFSIEARTYIRLREGASAEAVQRRVSHVMEGVLPPMMRGAYQMELVRIDSIALHEALHPDALPRLRVGSLVAALILFIALANFINLGVAMSARRRREIGVRKANGASRGQIAAQFLGESVATVLIAALFAAAAVEWLLPAVNGFLGTEATFDHGEPAVILAILAGALLLGLVAGAWPALLVSALPPAAILADRGHAGRGRGWVRSALVTVQFAILIGLLVSMAVIYRQRVFAMDEALRVDVDQVLTIAADCPAAFVAEVRRLPGVESAVCAGSELLDPQTFAFVETPRGRVFTDMISLLPGGFALLGIAPVAGTLDGLPPDGEEGVTRIVVNEAAVRLYGYRSPAAAIGQSVAAPGERGGVEPRPRIVAVVPDFAFYSVETAVKPTIYFARPKSSFGPGMVMVKLAGRSVPEALAGIDRAWRATGNSEPIERAFVSEHFEEVYSDLERSTRLFAIFAAIAAFLAAIGLVGLSVSAAERRTKEIGIRKALGATTGQVLGLLLSQLSRPVLWANFIAWPAAWWLMRSWLDTFAYRVPLDPWLFPAAGALALLIALASVGVQSWLVARKKPIHALRYE